MKPLRIQILKLYNLHYRIKNRDEILQQLYDQSYLKLIARQGVPIFLPF